MARKRKKESGRRTGLKGQIEVVNDQADEDVLPYVEKFISDMRSMQPMKEISLLTQEDARQAITTIERTLEQLNKRLGLARSLKTILETRRQSSEK